MDSSIWSAIITSVSSIFICCMGFRFGQQDQTTLSSRKIMHEQLTKLLAPLDLLLSKTDGSDWKTLKKSITDLISSNYVFVPPLLLERYKNLIAFDSCPAEEYIEFCIAVSSFYNWTKRKLGYPNDKYQINKEYTPARERSLFLQHISSYALPLFMAVLVTVFSLIAANTSTPQPTQDLSDAEFFLIAVLMAVGASVFSLFINHRRD